MAYLEGLALFGVKRAVLTGLDGLVIETLGRGAPPAEVLAAELASLARHMAPLAEALEGEVRRFTLTTETHELLALRVGEYLLGAVLERGMDRKAIGQELSRIALKLENL
jgi:predicted regulator of Ras-like GTPase activity (Roadblock/LC7/MglB family)